MQAYLITKADFLLDPEVIYLNHGSFGACPRPVFETYQSWQLELEKEPVEFLGRRLPRLMETARESLAKYLGTNRDDIATFNNPTTAINMVARSLMEGPHALLKPGDEILASDHEYGAMDRTWKYYCQKNGMRYIQQPIPVPVGDTGTLIDQLWKGVTDRTRAIFVSHITSPTALIFPVEEICRRAEERGILTIIDGAHAPGQIPLNLDDLGADIYTGAFHKWLMAPKGSAFLYTKPGLQTMMEPLVISWGYQSEKPGPSQYIEYHEWQGTDDPAATLSVPSAIEFRENRNWDQVVQECHKLAVEVCIRCHEITGMEPIYPVPAESQGDWRWFRQMFCVTLPEMIDVDKLQETLLRDHHIEVPVYRWVDLNLLRVSIQGYNKRADLEALIRALRVLLN